MVWGGSIFSDEGSGLTIINSTFANNSADPKCTTFGSGAVAGFTAWKVSFSTFSGNTGPTTGAISSSGQITAKGTIVAGATSVPNCNKKAITDAGHNISDDTSCGFAKTGSAENGDGVDPKLSAKGLSDNRGFTQTIALEPASPAVDAIPVDNCTDPNGNRLFTDQRGFPRPAPHHTMCDIGAFELQDSALGAIDTCRDDCEYRHQSCVDDADHVASDCYGTCNGLTRCREECFDEHRNAVKACDSQLDDCKNQCPPTPPM